MDYKKANQIIRDIENEKYHKIGGLGAEYTYLQEELYAVRWEEETYKPPRLIRARSPEEAYLKFNEPDSFAIILYVMPKFIKHMKHALGLTDNNNKAYRNFFETSSRSDSRWVWAYLTDMGLAEKRGTNVFELTDRGILYLEQLLGTSIEITY